MRSNRRRLTIYGTIAGLVVIAFFAWSISKALAQSPTGGATYPDGPPAHNVIVMFGLDYRTGEPSVTTLVYFGKQYVPCGTVVADVKLRCGRIARIVKGTDKLGRPSRNIRLARHEKLVGVAYGYQSLTSNKSLTDSIWTGRVPRKFALQKPNVFDNEPAEQTELVFLEAMVNDTRFQPYEPPTCDQVSCGK